MSAELVSLPQPTAAAASVSATNRDVATTRVMHVINGEHYSGAERVQDLLAEHLPSLGYEVTFACVKPGRFAERRKYQSARVISLSMQRRWDLLPAFRLARLLRAEGFALVHAHTPRSALVGRLAAWLAKVPFVYHVHSPTSRDTTHPWRNRANDWTERACLRRAAALLTVSRSLARHMTSLGYPESRIHVVPNGVPPADKLRDASPPCEKWCLGAVALFRPRKGLEVLLDALAMLKQQGLAVRLRAVGPFETSAYEAAIHAQVERLGLQADIDWVGFTSDVASELQRMDLFVLPSLFGEGLPMVVLEAMAAGVPVVGTAVEGVPEAITHGLHGVIARPGDAQDLASCIGRVVHGELDWSALRRNAMEAHRARFSATHMARGVAAVYDRVLLRHG